MKILEICGFSAGICGVFARVKEEAVRLSKNNEVRIFSSNITKGTGKIAGAEDRIGNVKIRRFPAINVGGESYMIFDSSLKKAIMDYKPNVIIAHSYRHVHTHIALEMGKKIGAKVILVPHGPFGDNSQRSIFGIISVWFYDKFIGPGKLKRFDKILAITRWEYPYLKTLGVEESKIEYVPNGIPKEFFEKRRGKEQNSILFLGRVSPVKDLETLIRALKLTRNYIELEIVGPAEDYYLKRIKNLIDKLELNARIKISPAIYDLNEKIKKIDSHRIFVLPSRREAMPQSLIEAMARERIVISSDNLGSKELIESGKNGFLFKIGKAEELAEKIDLVDFMNREKDMEMRKKARKSVEGFEWDKIIKKVESLIKK